MRYALIKDGVVNNIIEIESRNAHEFPNAIQSDIAAIGDIFEKGRFYRDGELLKTQEEILQEKITILEEQIGVVNAAIFEIAGEIYG